MVSFLAVCLQDLDYSVPEATRQAVRGSVPQRLETPGGTIGYHDARSKRSAKRSQLTALRSGVATMFRSWEG